MPIHEHFTPVLDAAGHNVVGVTFDRPIPWPAFDGGQSQHEVQPAEQIEAILGGTFNDERVAERERRQNIEAALTDLADEITEEVEGDLDALKDGLAEIKTYLTEIRTRLNAALPLLHSASALRFGQDTAAQIGLLRDACKHALSDETLTAADEIATILGSCERRLLAAVTDLTKQATEARAKVD